jgi:RNA polymerase sigma-70 factor (ECF subfamily)
MKGLPSVKELEEIARKAKKYEPGGFEALFDLFFERIRRYMYFHVGDLEVADDLSSEVFAQALKSIGNFEDRGGTIGRWLYGIARNVLAEHLRNAERLPTVSLEGEPSPIPEGNPEDETLRLMTYEDLYRAVRGLPPEQREIIILRFIEGYPVKESAAIMDRSPGAVRALQHRAVVSLRKALKRETR